MCKYGAGMEFGRRERGEGTILSTIAGGCGRLERMGKAWGETHLCRLCGLPGVRETEEITAWLNSVSRGRVWESSPVARFPSDGRTSRPSPSGSESCQHEAKRHGPD